MKPIFCHLGVTHSSNIISKEYPTISEWREAVSSLREVVDKGFMLNFGTASVLAREGVMELISYGRKIGFKTNVTTNPFIINEEMAKRINDSGLEYINISLDFPDKNAHGRLNSMEDIYQGVMDAVLYLHRFCGSSLHKGISCSINDMNVDNILEFGNSVFRDNRIDWIQFMVMERPDSIFRDSGVEKDGKDVSLWPKDIKKTKEAIDELIQLKKRGYKINNSLIQLGDFKSYYESPYKFVNKAECNFDRVIQINSFGDIFLCHRFENFGNIKRDKIKAAWNTEKSQEIRKIISSCKKNCHYLLNCFLDNATSAVSFKKVNAKNGKTENNQLDVPKPGFCCLGITDKCMLKCRMCFKWQNDIAEENPPTLEQYKNFISNLKELVDDNFRIHFGGGEALLFKGVLDLVKFSVQKGFSTNIASNGWLIDEDMAKSIGDSGLNEINLSLDSLNETTHDYLRGVKGVYRRVMNAIKHLNKYSQNTKIAICSVIYDWNLDELTSLLEWGINNNRINSIFFLVPMQPNSTGVDKAWWKSKYGYLWPKDTEKAHSFVDKVLKIRATGCKIGNTVPQLEAFKLYLQHPEKFVKKTKCNLDRAVHVSAVGDIFLCFRWDILGNIKNEDDIRKIWFSAYTNDVRKKIETCKDNCHYLLNCFFKSDYPFGVD